MIIGVPKETFPGERRVALTPAAVPDLRKLGLQVVVEAGAGALAGCPDQDYRKAEAEIVPEHGDVFAKSDIILQIRALGANNLGQELDLDHLRPGLTVIGFTKPFTCAYAGRLLAEKQVDMLAMELIPRISRAQSMDALSSQSTVAGYKAVLLAADTLPRLFPMMMTAAGTIPPARVLVIGAGVAGLSAIATAHRLGAAVKAYDLRPAVKEQVESLGASFLELDLSVGEAEDDKGYAKAQAAAFYDRQRELMTAAMKECDVVITTALVPGRKPPILVTREMLEGMPDGSVVVDLAAERGGNCAATKPDETVVERGVTILGPTNIPAGVPYHASQMYARNLVNLLRHLVREGKLELDPEDPITAGTLVTRGGEVVHPIVLEHLEKEDPKE